MNAPGLYILFMKLLGCFFVASSFTALYFVGDWGFMALAMVGIGTCGVALYDEKKWEV